jgi:hypothetical protein
VVVARDTTPPRLHAIARRGRLRVHVVDTQTPWVELTLRLRKGGTLESLRLPRTRPGTTVTAPLARVWFGEVAATDSTGNRTTIVLGRVGRVHTPPR